MTLGHGGASRSRRGKWNTDCRVTRSGGIVAAPASSGPAQPPAATTTARAASTDPSARVTASGAMAVAAVP